MTVINGPGAHRLTMLDALNVTQTV